MDDTSAIAPASASLSGKVALVTGGTKGIGHGIALALASAGADVIITGRDTAGGANVTAEITAYGRRTAFLPGDLADEDFVGGLIAQAIGQFGQLDILVNNAGWGPETPALDIPLEEWRRCQLINLEVPFRLAQAAGRHFVDQGRGVIINISSVNGQRGSAEEAHYCAAKHGLNGLTKTLAKEWAKLGVRVNAIAPGLVLTEMTRHWQETPGLIERMSAFYPANRPGYPRDIGGVAVFLASDAADFMHGQVLAIDGGLMS